MKEGDTTHGRKEWTKTKEKSWILCKIYDGVSDVLKSAIHLVSVEKFPSRYKKPDSDPDADIIDAILGEMPLREKSDIANMDKNQVETLQSVFDMYIRSKSGSDASDDDFRDIMFEIWETLKKTHRIRSVNDGWTDQERLWNHWRGCEKSSGAICAYDFSAWGATLSR